MARRSKKTEEQMKLFDEGGLKDEGGTVDPVSGNDVPVGSTQKEVRDDIPAQLSEGEFVFPADVTRYIGLENLMELRNKAKQGLAQMDAMGQMGNSEEATMDDTAEMDVDIDAMIDEFDPNSPETMEFNVGGAVLPTQQQFSYGFMPPSQQGFQAPGYSVMPQQSQFVTSPARTAVGQPPVAPELRRYVGPNDEILMIPFYDGKPMQGYTVPAGYKFKAEEEAVAETPEVIAPKVEDQEDRSDDREREAEREAQMAKDKEISNTLASYNKDFAEQWSEDPFNTGKMGIGGPMAAAWDSVQTYTARTPAIEAIAKEYGIDLENYTNKGIKGFFSKYDDERFAKDLKEKHESPAEITQRKANEKARAPEIAALRAKEAERLNQPGAFEAREAKAAANRAITEANVAKMQADTGDDGDGDGPNNGSGSDGSFSGGRDADGWGE